MRSNLRLEFPIRKQHSWEPWLMCVLILNRLRHVPVNHKFNKAILKEKREALRLLRANSSKKNIWRDNCIANFKSQDNFKDRKLALQQKRKRNQRILPFVTKYQPSVPNTQILLRNWQTLLTGVKLRLRRRLDFGFSKLLNSGFWKC